MSIFSPLFIHQEGVGDYRLNRFRLYFTIPPNRLSPDGQRLANGPYHGTPVAQLGGLLTRNFPAVFNPNIAVVTRRGESYGGQDTLRFLITASLFGLSTSTPGIPGQIADYAVPDVHTDWVGIQWQDPSVGFTVQTLERHFSEPEDHMAEGMSAGGTITGAQAVGGLLFGPAGGAAGTGVGFAAAPIAAAVTHSINTRHFLAGRRSWAVKPAAWFGTSGVRNPAAITPNLWAIETAAIERYSHEAFRILDTLMLLGDFDMALRDVWAIFLSNFVKAMQFTPVMVPVWSHTHQFTQVHNIPNTILSAIGRTFPVCFIEDRHSSRTGMEGGRQFSEVTALFRQIYPP